MLINRVPTFNFTIGIEGLLSLVETDGGNYVSGVAGVGPLIGSKYGVSAAQLAAYLDPVVVTPAIMAAITTTTAEAIFVPEFWSTLGCDGLNPGIDLSVCDHGYNRGPAPSARVIQRLCAATVDGWLGEETIAAANLWATQVTSTSFSASATRQLQNRLGVTVDGVIGPKTLGALHAIPSGPTMLALCRLADAQLADYRTLELFAVDGNGWTNRVYSRLGAGLALVTD